MLEHGGRLLDAARRFGIPHADWLDLSTGIAPWPYPLPAAPVEVWQRLPEEGDGLEDTARAYYGAEALAVPGSQWAIETIPRLVEPGRVAMPQPIYAEHPAAWRAAGHSLVGWQAPADYAVVCNPGNPTGKLHPRTELLRMAATVKLLVVDEAFIDAEPTETLAGSGLDNVIVLRSLGKFFGLAGVRLGFVIATPDWRERLRARLSPWAVSHPARWAARLALADGEWQAAQRQRLCSASRRLAALLCRDEAVAGCALFRYQPTPRANAHWERLARRAILARCFTDPPALRFGLPADEAQWRRLETALQAIE
ncbi:MAG: threonine-phosphate decarboxylase CobD [Rhodocyclaceae bacterium]